MDQAELLVATREEIDDEIEPYLWADSTLLRHLREAAREAAIRARLLVESERADLCHIAMVPGQAQYTLNPALILIRRAVLQSDLSTPLCRTTAAGLDGICSTWRTQAGRPEYLVVNQQGAGKTLIVSPIPTQAEILYLTVWRLPTPDEEFTEGDDTVEPPFEEQHHGKLIHWAAFRALTKRDAEQEAKADAADQIALFEAHFGPRPTARQLQQLAIDRTVGTEAVWF